MIIKITVLGLYFIIVLLLGFLARSKLRESPSQYFLAGRTLGPFILIGTMMATNFSAFTIFGTSGAGYRDGLAFFPIIGFGTGFMALTFWLVGRKVWMIGKEHGLVSPAELVGVVYKNILVRRVFALIMIIFTIPYLALQPLSGGYVLNELFGLPQWAGAIIVTGIMLIYILRGGFKAVAWTDVFQGFLMIGLMIIALIVIASHFGGFSAAVSDIRLHHPELLSRPGGIGTYTIGIWFSYLALWFLCDPMFPQLFQRFYAAKSERSIAWTMVSYPVICSFVFFFPVMIGLFGRLAYPDLSLKEADNVISLLATSIGGDLLGTLILAAGLAALMSTMDSQLLTLSSIFTRDILPIFTKRTDHSSLVGRFFVVGLALLGLIIAINPPATILEIATWAFTGLAVLFPTVLFGLYLKNPLPSAAIVSMITGQILLIAYATNLLSPGGLLPVIPIIVIITIVFFMIQIGYDPADIKKTDRRNLYFAIGFALLLLLSIDFWNWNKEPELFLNLPLWVWYFIGLSLIQTVVMFFWVKKHLKT